MQSFLLFVFPSFLSFHRLRLPVLYFLLYFAFYILCSINYELHHHLSNPALLRKTLIPIITSEFQQMIPGKEEISSDKPHNYHRARLSYTTGYRHKWPKYCFGVESSTLKPTTVSGNLKRPYSPCRLPPDSSPGHVLLEYTGNALMFVNTTAIAYQPKVCRSLKIWLVCDSSCVHKRQSITSRARAPVPWERLPSKRVAVGPCRPLPTGNSRRVLEYLQSPSIHPGSTFRYQTAFSPARTRRRTD